MFYHHLTPVSFIQTLTTLNLWFNQIEAQGAQYLGDALRHNTVRSSLLHVFTIISFLSLSYRHSLHSTLTTIKSKLKVHNIWLKHCDTIQWDHHSFMFLPSSHSCLFHTDTHYTQPLRQSNWSSRCTIFGWSIATQYSEIITPSCFTIISFFSLWYRHSLHSTLATIKSELKVHNISSAWRRQTAISQCCGDSSVDFNFLV